MGFSVQEKQTPAVINPDGTAPANDYYTRAALDLQNLTMHAASDIARTDETEAATIMNASLRDFLNMGKAALQMDFDIDGTTLRWEHVSYWAPTVQEDLTQPDKVQYIADKWEFTFVSENHPKQDNYKWAQETDEEGGDFDGVPIRYENICVTGNKDAKERTHATDVFLTNIGAVVGDEDFFRSKKIILVSNYGGLMNTAVCPLSGKIRLNGNLAFSYLHPRYHDAERPFREGYINNVLTTMQSVTRNRKQTALTFPLDCQGYDNYDPGRLIRTQLGAGMPQTDQYNEPEDLITVNLLFP